MPAIKLHAEYVAVVMQVAAARTPCHTIGVRKSSTEDSAFAASAMLGIFADSGNANQSLVTLPQVSLLSESPLNLAVAVQVVNCHIDFASYLWRCCCIARDFVVRWIDHDAPLVVYLMG